MNEKRMEDAMTIILHAGDARLYCNKALKAISKSDITLAKENLKEAQKKITAAHRVQTDAIQAETRGEHAEYSMLFAHAQDTLMTIYSEINIAKQLIKVFGTIEQRLTALEGGRGCDDEQRT